MSIELSPRGGHFLVSTTMADDVFTREDITDEQRMFADTAAAFMRNEVVPQEARIFAHDWAHTRELLRKAGELDLLRIEIPEQYGGLALSKVSGALVGEQIAVHPSFGASLGAHSAIGTLPLVYFGNDAQKAKYLPKLASGEWIGAYALTEPGSGSDALAAKTTATLSADGRHYVLNGQKMWITNGGFADLFTIFAKVDGRDFTAFLVERTMGVVSGAEEKKLGLDGSSTTALMLDEVKVPVENVLGRVGEGHRVAFNILNLGRVKLGARNMSCARQALAHTAKYATTRRQFGHAIGEFGLIQEKLAEMAIRCFAGDAMVYRTLGAVDRALESIDPADGEAVLKAIEAFAVECSINKVYTSEGLAYVTDEAIQIFGGNGYSREFPVERAYRDARITRIYEGTNEINRLLIPTRLLKAKALTSADDETRRPAAVSPLHDERTLLDRTKAAAIIAISEGQAIFGAAFRDQQELLARMADLAIQAYALESAICRTEKLHARRNVDAAALAIDMTRVLAASAAERVVSAGRPIAHALRAHHRDAILTDALSAVATFDAGDTIGARRRIASAVLRDQRSPL